MKTFFILLLTFLVIHLPSFSADWDLFPKDQKSYFSSPNLTGLEQMQLYIMDSILPQGMENILYFNKNLNIQGAGSCYGEPFLNSFYSPPEPEVKSLTENSDTIFYFNQNGNQSFFFLKNKLVGQSWKVHSGDSWSQDSITITFSSIKLDTFLGIIDSVRIYDLSQSWVSPILFDNFQMKLSKKYGLIDFVPFSFFFRNQPSNIYSNRLIGITKDTSIYGYQQPKFEDYFHLSPRDLLYWEYEYESYDIHNLQHYYLYYRDSIKEVIIQPDTIKYIYNQIWGNSNGGQTIYPDLEKIFVKSQFENIIGSPPFWLGFGTNQYQIYSIWPNTVDIWRTKNLTIEKDSISNHTISTFYFSNEFQAVDTTSCSVLYGFDNGLNLSLNSLVGVSNVCRLGSWESSCHSVIGSRINKVLRGTILSNLSGIQGEILSQKIKTYPNPASDFIRIDLPNSQKEGLEFRIINRIGQSIGNGLLRDGKVSIEDLASGLYFIELTGKQNQYRGMFIKQ
jgi:Secretion system C-terminal sorting domain